MTSTTSDRFPEPPAVISESAFELASLSMVRRAVKQQALKAGFSERRSADLVLAASEVASNSVIHGGGAGTLRVWTDGAALVCEFSDAGHIANPSAVTQPPATDIGGRGLWVATQMCDRMELRSGPEGTIVRLSLFLDNP